jgi:hypothetical protein
VWNLLDENRITHSCNFWLLRGVVADQPAIVSGTFYSTRSIPKHGGTKPNPTKYGHDRCPTGKHSSADSTKQHYTFQELQAVTGLTFSALLIDCEGCIETLFAGNTVPLRQLLASVRTIILEADMPIGAADCEHHCVDYAKWVTMFAEIGLKVVHKEQDPVYPKIFHYVFQRFAAP